MRDFYIDIDGVLRIWSPPKWRNQAAPFLQWSLRHFLCFFLTSWREKSLIKDRCLAPLGIRHLADKFGYPKWGDRKTDAIDFDRDFYWADDEALQDEMEVLRNHGASHDLIRINPHGEAELKTLATILARRERLEHDNAIPDLSGKVPEVFPEGET
jgi:hypothetical protein